MSTIEILMVTCCLEPSRADILNQVIHNLEQQAPELMPRITVFDNASTEFAVKEQLTSHFTNVFQSDHNVGYWSAIDWWLSNLKTTPDYTYIIESDMMHYNLHWLGQCKKFLDHHPDIGAMRLHEYSIKDFHLYNKDAPVPGSRSNLWQSHTNRVTGESVKFEQIEGVFWKTNFLTQLPALNRFETMKSCFEQLSAYERFTEHEFQRLYHVKYPQISILDGGMFNCDLNPYGTKVITGSWTDAKELQRLGYQSTRFASITPKDQYTVQRG